MRSFGSSAWVLLEPLGEKMGAPSGAPKPSGKRGRRQGTSKLSFSLGRLAMSTGARGQETSKLLFSHGTFCNFDWETKVSLGSARPTCCGNLNDGPKGDKEARVDVW